MESQFLCGKCRKPVSSKYSKCLECGSLGPHTFSDSVQSGIEGGTSVAQSRHKRNSYPSEKIDIPQAPPSHSERYAEREPPDIQAAPAHSLPGHDSEDDSRFPAGMRSRSPILNYVEEIDESSGKGSRQHREQDTSDVNDGIGRETPDDDDQEKRAARGSQNRIITIIAGITLVLILIVAVLYVVNNFDALTTWLASPTVPEVFRSSD